MPLHKVSVSPMEITTATSAPYQTPAKVITKRESSPEHSSQTSSVTSNGFDICRICHCEGDAEVPLMAPCYCAGSLRYVHQACLQQWIKSSNIRCCELCKFQFVMQTKTKPFREWEHLEMTANERRKLLCAVLFHAVALTCVIWSLYVLIDRTLDEIHTGILEWPFWTKLVVVAIGFTGGVVFMYIQCKAYLHIYQRWKAYNLVIYVQNAPEKPSLPSPQFAIKSEAQPVHIDLPPHLCTATPSYEHASMWEETNEAPPSFDITKFKNLHIFFNEEDRIPVQKDEQESRLVDYLEAGGEPNSFGRSNVFGNAKPGEQDKMNAVRKTWHIQIEKSVGGPDIAKTIDNRTYDEVVKANLMEPRPYRSEDFQLGRNNEDKDTTPAVLNLQINKADNIVITIGSTNDEHAAKSGDSLADTGSDTINKTKVDMENKSNSNDDEGSEDSLSGCGSPTCRLLPSRPKAYPFDKRQSPVDPETGSQYPLLAQTTNSETNTTN